MLEVIFVFVVFICLIALVFYVGKVKWNLESKISEEIAEHHNNLQSEILNLMKRMEAIEDIACPLLIQEVINKNKTS